MKQYQHTLFLFHRDLRLIDNTGLLAALRQSETVTPLFIIDSRQVSQRNPYLSMPAVSCMVQSLDELHNAIKDRGAYLTFLHGVTHDVVDHLLTHHKDIEAVFSNYDYTPFARARDEQLAHICAQREKSFHQYHDYLLHEPSVVLKKDGKPYTIFTPFYKKAIQLPVRSVDTFHGGSLSIQKLKGSLDHAVVKKLLAFPPAEQQLVHGGRAEGLRMLKKGAALHDYKTVRDQLDASTTHLSAHLKFGTLSVREVYESFKELAPQPALLVRQLYWRDFFTQIAFHFPLVFGQPFNKRYQELVWENNADYFKRWCMGTTGFPIVDAGMRELNETGFMHNRARMIVASFLTKDLHIDWRLGEQYFAHKLTDYDPAVNNGSWQWAASTGCDAQPYFRIFNPWLQQKKFDADCVYIKRWVPELKNVSSPVIHTWYKEQAAIRTGYPRPMLDHALESSKAKSYYKKANKR